MVQAQADLAIVRAKQLTRPECCCEPFAEVHEKGSRASAQSMGFSVKCEPCEPCEPYKFKLLERASLPLAHGLPERVPKRLVTFPP